MNLLLSPWLLARTRDGTTSPIAPVDMGDARYVDVVAPRPDFRGALYQFLIGLLQSAHAPEDADDWRDLWREPPDPDTLRAAFEPILSAFELQAEGPAFLQDADLPSDANQLPVIDLLIDAGSDSNLFFNKPPERQGLCACCAAQALLTLQLNAPSGGRGIRTSLRGGGPMTTLLLPREDATSLWQKLWLNVLPKEALGYPEVGDWSTVLPWLAPTRTSDGPRALDTPPESVHPLQAYWGMPRRIRLDASTAIEGDCMVCGASGARLFQHYRTRHGGTNYTGAWRHPLTPYRFDPKHEKPPLSVKGQPGGIGYRDWLGLTLGQADLQPAAAQVVSHFHEKIKQPAVRLWCFGYDMNNMKARCWHDATLPVHVVPEAFRNRFQEWVKAWIDAARDGADCLHKRVKAAWFSQPGDVKPEPAIWQSFWLDTEPAFYDFIESLSRTNLDDREAVAMLGRGWLREVRRSALAMFEYWVLAGPIGDGDMERVVNARAGLLKDLNSGKGAAANLRKLIDPHLRSKEQA